MEFQWYPGHMTKAKRMMQENIKLIDIVVELVDARIPISSKNPDIDELAKNKFRLILLNKTDLADEKVTALWEEYFKSQGFFVAKINARDGKGVKSIHKVIQEACFHKPLYQHIRLYETINQALYPALVYLQFVM